MAKQAMAGKPGTSWEHSVKNILSISTTKTALLSPGLDQENANNMEL